MQSAANKAIIFFAKLIISLVLVFCSLALITEVGATCCDLRLIDRNAH